MSHSKRKRVNITAHSVKLEDPPDGLPPHKRQKFELVPKTSRTSTHFLACLKTERKPSVCGDPMELKNERIAPEPESSPRRCALKVEESTLVADLLGDSFSDGTEAELGAHGTFSKPYTDSDDADLVSNFAEPPPNSESESDSAPLDAYSNSSGAGSVYTPSRTTSRESSIDICAEDPHSNSTTSSSHTVYPSPIPRLRATTTEHRLVKSEESDEPIQMRAKGSSRTQTPDEIDELEDSPEPERTPPSGHSKRSFSSLVTSKRKRRAARGEPSFPCPHAATLGCLKMFSRLGDAVRHGQSKKHTGEGTCKCRYCGKTLSRQDALYRHLRDFCGAASRASWKMKRRQVAPGSKKRTSARLKSQNTRRIYSSPPHSLGLLAGHLSLERHFSPLPEPVEQISSGAHGDDRSNECSPFDSESPVRISVGRRRRTMREMTCVSTSDPNAIHNVHDSNREPYSCVICGKPFQKEGVFIKHEERCRRDEEKAECIAPACGVRFASRRAAKHHFAAIHSEHSLDS
ncbi:hypothetical protein B0H11DRAFT_2431231 [Mycena galericulata]|nr:hypothetical protein B0H11DRAFT_2431231 [Mycena galericulata]